MYIIYCIGADVDYNNISETVNFYGCQRQHCVDIAIVDDEVLENTESFSITLLPTYDFDSAITIEPAVGQIMIRDNDGIIKQ